MITLQEMFVPPLNFLQECTENDAFYQSIQKANLDGFQFGYFIIYRNNKIITVAPYFVMDFNLNTLLPEGILKRCTNWIKFNLACIGNPIADFGRIHGEISVEILNLINQSLAKKGSLLAYKGFVDELPLADFTQVNSLPVPVLQLGPNYFSELPSERRNLLKRKLKKAVSLRYEEHQGLPLQWLEKVYALYLQTYQKAELKFEKLNPQYFLETGIISHYLLFFEEEKLIGFTQLIGRNHYLVNRYIGLDYSRSHEYGLYFVMFIKTIEFAIDKGFTQLELGATSYEFKRRLGAKIIPTWNYFQHVNPILNWGLKKFKNLLEPSASELK